MKVEKMEINNLLGENATRKNRLAVFLRAKRLKYLQKTKQKTQKPFKPMLKLDRQKNTGKKLVACALVIAVGLMGISLYPIIKQALIKKNISSLPVEIHAPVENLTPIDTNTDGQIVETPDIPPELFAAYDFLNEKLANDASIFEVDIYQIGQIKGIYKINLANENYSKDKAIQIIVSVDGKDLILEYTALEEDFKDGFVVDADTNLTNTLLSFTANLSNCYPSNVVEQDEQKEILIEKIKEIYQKNAIIGDPIIFAENAVVNNFEIPVYIDGNCVIYSIKESVLAENCDDINFEAVINLLAQYIEKKNDFFEVKQVSEIDNANAIYSALKEASQIINDENDLN